LPRCQRTLLWSSLRSAATSSPRQVSGPMRRAHICCAMPTSVALQLCIRFNRHIDWPSVDVFEKRTLAQVTTVGLLLSSPRQKQSYWTFVSESKYINIRANVALVLDACARPLRLQHVSMPSPGHMHGHASEPYRTPARAHTHTHTHTHTCCETQCSVDMSMQSVELCRNM
jgi:hypothetical protein